MAQQDGSIAQVYAEALYDVSVENGSILETEEELLGLGELIEKDVELRLFLEAPSIPFEAKAKLLRGALKDTSAPVLHLLLLLIEHRRMPAFREIVDAYHRHANMKAGVAEFELESATAMPGDQVDRLRQVLNMKLKKKIVVHQSVKPELLGGFVLSHGDMQWDASVARRLSGMVEKMVVAPNSVKWTE